MHLVMIMEVVVPVEPLVLRMHGGRQPRTARSSAKAVGWPLRRPLCATTSQRTAANTASPTLSPSSLRSKSQCCARGVRASSTLLVSHRGRRRARSARDRDNALYVRAAQGIRRPLSSVYRKVRRLYDPHHRRGPFSAAEDARLPELLALHGRAWTKIGDMLGRSAESVRDHVLVLGNHQRGQWAADEKQRLAAALERAGEGSAGPPWADVARAVGTRTAQQCMERCREAGATEKIHKASPRYAHMLHTLVAAVAATGAVRVADVDFPAVAAAMHEFRISGPAARRRFRTLCTRVPRALERPLPDIITDLQRIIAWLPHTPQG